MTVPLDDSTCRFIGPDKWTRRDKRPTARAFKPPHSGLSVWHTGRLRENGTEPADLLQEQLDGFGQAHYLVRDYFDAADDAGGKGDISVEWDPEGAQGTWKQWNYAHIRIQIVEGTGEWGREFRRILSARARCVVSPEKYLES